MHIVVCLPEADAAREWAAELRTHLPGADVGIDGERAMPQADYAVGWSPPEGFFERHPALRAFLSVAAGVDRLLRNPGLPPALPVVRLEDAGMGWQMTEYCVHEVLRLRGRFDDYAAQQARAAWQPHPPRRREATRVGVLGLGVLGRQVATTLAGLGYPVAGYTRTPTRVERIASFAGPAQWVPFLARSDVLIVLAPLTADTANLIDAHALAQLPRGAYLINIARGGLVDDDALLAALDAGQLAGATLDVFRTEPLPPEHPFWRHPRVRVTPHVSGPTLVPESAAQVADKIARLARGDTVGGLVDRLRGY
jgi:glyoxylate/hydroxypyruvate reductase A